MATINTRAKSPTRIEAIANALKPGPVFNTGVLLGNWVEDRIECPKGGTLYFPPKHEIDYEKMKPESRQPDFRLNKLNSLQCRKSTIQWGHFECIVHHLEVPDRNTHRMATINTRAKSPTRIEAIANALKPGPVFNTGVLLGNWVEDRIECPKGGTLYFPPKHEIDYEKMKPESRQPDFRLNKLNSLQGHFYSIYRHDSHDTCSNFATTNDLVYNHLPKPLCGPNLRYYKRCAHQFYPQPDLLKCFGNVTEWGLGKYKHYEWACTDVSDYMSSMYEDTYVPPQPDQYLQSENRKARNSSFTKSFRFKMTKQKSKSKS